MREQRGGVEEESGNETLDEDEGGMPNDESGERVGEDEEVGEDIPMLSSQSVLPTHLSGKVYDTQPPPGHGSQVPPAGPPQTPAPPPQHRQVEATPAQSQLQFQPLIRCLRTIPTGSTTTYFNGTS